MKVTVSIITFNHAPFIRQAIDSVLMQRTNFDFEILIGEDESSDGTREIVKEYAAKHPGKIRLFLHSRKDVHYINGKPTGRRNFVNNLQNAHSQYVALLEGDDYWLSPDKLQRQVDYLETNPGCSVCFHNVAVLYEDTGKVEPYHIKVRQPVYTLAEFLEGHLVPHTGSVLFRRDCLGDFPDWYFRVAFGDLPLLALLGLRGDLGFIDEVMGVYRKHGGGIWSGGVAYSAWSNERAIKGFLAMLEYNEILRENFPAPVRPVLQKRISGLNYELVWLYRRQDNPAKMREHLLRAWRASFLHPHFSTKFVIKASLVAFFPFLHRTFKSLKARGKAPTPL